MDFRSLHFHPEPVLICNVWDVFSAVIAEQAGYQCIGTSSAAISRMLGYSDGEEMSILCAGWPSYLPVLFYLWTLAIIH